VGVKIFFIIFLFYLSPSFRGHQTNCSPIKEVSTRFGTFILSFSALTLSISALCLSFSAPPPDLVPGVMFLAEFPGVCVFPFRHYVFPIRHNCIYLWDINNFIEKEGSVKEGFACHPSPYVPTFILISYVNGGMMVSRAASTKVQISVKSR
jgi:hypothetical protein